MPGRGVFGDYLAHGCCYLWESRLVWLHVISDILITLAYYSIPAALFYFIYKRRDIPFSTIFVLFGVFILACGTTHLLAAFTVYVPAYWLEGWVKAFTAAVSLVSAFMFIPLIPQAIAMPSLTKALEEIKGLNRALELELIEREESAKKLREKETLLVQQSKMAAMGEMISLIAHQWKQPLNAISITAQDLGDAFSYGELDARYLSESKNMIIKHVNFMVNTMDEFRQFLRPSKEKVSFNVKTVIEELVGMFCAYYLKDNISLNIVTEEGIDINDVSGYLNEFKQVILNIINNSKDAILSKRSGKETSGPADKIDIYIGAQGDRTNITVCDNGGGIPEDILDRIFDANFTTKPSTIGTGIGLYMSKTIIETNMGWKLSARNIEGGAELKIEI